jgi:hypothetical protein
MHVSTRAPAQQQCMRWHGASLNVATPASRYISRRCSSLLVAAREQHLFWPSQRIRPSAPRSIQGRAATADDFNVRGTEAEAAPAEGERASSPPLTSLPYPPLSRKLLALFSAASFLLPAFTAAGALACTGVSWVKTHVKVIWSRFGVSQWPKISHPHAARTVGRKASPCFSCS